MQSTKTADISQTEWTWNADYQRLFNKAKSIIKCYAYMKFYDKTKPLYLETDESGVVLGTSLLQTRNSTSCPRDMAQDNNILRSVMFTSKSLSSTEKRYRNIERKALGILNSLEKFHHYCFMREVSMNTDHKPLEAIFKQDMATLFQRQQQILIRIYQYRVKIIYKPGPDLFIADCLSRQNQKEDKDEEIAGMQVSIDAVETVTNIPECMMICEL